MENTQSKGTYFEIIAYQLEPILEKIQRYGISEYAYVYHDRDLITKSSPIEDIDWEKYGLTLEEAKEEAKRDPRWFKAILPETPQPKKPHYHILINKGYNTKLQTVLNQFEIRTARICEWDERIRYFTHKEHPEKAQYSNDEVHIVSDTRTVEEAFGSKVRSEEQAVKQLVKMMAEYAKNDPETGEYLGYKGYVQKVMKANLWTYYRRSYSALQPLLYEYGILHRR